jgi:MoaA/NifB/PqqE/SkfB family radical SAM enzyme
MAAPFSTPFSVSVDAQGHVILPDEIKQNYGLEPGGELSFQVTPDGVLLRPPLSQLRKVYIEPTSRCNLTCRTCMRNAWGEPMGTMSPETFHHILDDLDERKPKASVFFGGFGEPLTHPGIAEMVQQAVQVASRVELITNGLLLDANLAAQLVKAGLNTLWVSLDGASPESYADVRLSESLKSVLKNISMYREQYRKVRGGEADIGVAFVAMKRNINELPDLLNLSTRLGVSRYIVTNVLPYTPEMCDEVLYNRSIDRINWQATPWHPNTNLPEIDLNSITREALFRVWTTRPGGQFKRRNHCPFIEQRSTTVGWEGSVSPCLALLHSHESYLFDHKRSITRYRLGNVNETPLAEIWKSDEYKAFRHKVEEFDFSPCTYCASCEMVEANQEDCFGNTFPTCGGCLWAQGVIQCP